MLHQRNHGNNLCKGRRSQHHRHIAFTSAWTLAHPTLGARHFKRHQTHAAAEVSVEGTAEDLHLRKDDAQNEGVVVTTHVHTEETTTVSVHRLKTPDYVMVTSEESLLSMLEDLRSSRCIAVDCEGVKLGERAGGKLTLMQISAKVTQSGKTTLRIWIVDIHELKWKAFHYKTKDKLVNLKHILEDEKIAKLLYDVRSDSAQMQFEYGVRLKAAYDLQVAEVAVRQIQRIPTSVVLSLDKALSNYLPHSATLVEDIRHSYEIARVYHYGNKTEVWEQRPLTPSLLHYAATDVRYLHQLLEALHMKLPTLIVDKVKRESTMRIQTIAPSDKRRAEAPQIVKGRDFAEMMSSRQPAASTPSSQSTNSDSNGSANGNASTAVLSAEDQAIEKLFASSNWGGYGSSSSGSTRQAGNAKRKREAKKDDAADAAATQDEAAPDRAVPRKVLAPLPVPGTITSSTSSTPGSTATVAALPGALSTPAPAPPSFLLQPRKRAEGEEAPTWIYDSLKPAKASEPESADETGGDESSSQAPSLDNGAGIKELNGAGSKVEGEEEKVKKGLLLWSNDTTKKPAEQAGAGLQRPSLQRPARRP